MDRTNVLESRQGKAFILAKMYKAQYILGDTAMTRNTGGGDTNAGGLQSNKRRGQLIQSLEGYP